MLTEETVPAVSSGVGENGESELADVGFEVALLDGAICESTDGATDESGFNVAVSTALIGAGKGPTESCAKTFVEAIRGRARMKIIAIRLSIVSPIEARVLPKAGRMFHTNCEI